MEGSAEGRPSSTTPSTDVSSSTTSDPVLDDAAAGVDMSHELGLDESLKSAGSGPLAALARVIEVKDVTTPAARASAVDADVDELPPGQVFGDDRAGTMTDIIKQTLARGSEPGSAVASTSYRYNQRAAVYEQQDDVVLSASHALLDDVGEKASSSEDTRTATDSESSPRNWSPRRQSQRQPSANAGADDQLGDGSVPFSATQPPDDDMFDELAVDRELERSKQAIALQAERDALWEEAFLQRRQILDEEAMESRGNLTSLFAAFELQTEVVQTEDEVRSLIYMSEAAARGALGQEHAREHQRIRSRDAELHLTNAESVTRAEILRMESEVLEHARLRHREALARVVVRADEDATRRRITDVCEHERALAQRVLEQVVAVVSATSTAEDAARGTLEQDCDLEQRCLFDGARESWQLLTMEKRERDAAAQLEMSSRRAALMQEAARLVATYATLLFQSEAQQRSVVEAQESATRSRLLASHKKASENFVPRKPPVPRCSRVIRVPHRPTPPPPEPPKTAALYPPQVPDDPNSRPASSSYSPRPKIKKVKPLPLRRLPPVPPVSGPDPIRPSEPQCRLLATATDESVGRKSLHTREQHEWLSMISTFRHALHTVDHEQRSPGERSLQHAYRTSTYPFHIADKESARFAVLKEEAKRKRLHHEERYRLQALVTKLIAVDIAFDSRIAARLSAGHLGASRPAFSCAFSEPNVWDLTPNKKGVDRARLSDDVPARQRVESSGNGLVPQRPHTAGVGCPRPPAAPRTAAPRSAASHRAPPKRAAAADTSGVDASEGTSFAKEQQRSNDVSPPMASYSPPSSHSASTASSRSSSPDSPASSASSRRSGTCVNGDSQQQPPAAAVPPESTAAADGGGEETLWKADEHEQTLTPDARNDSYASATDDAGDVAGSTNRTSGDDGVGDRREVSVEGAPPQTLPDRDVESNSESSSGDSWHPMTEQSP